MSLSATGAQNLGFPIDFDSRLYNSSYHSATVLHSDMNSNDLNGLKRLLNFIFVQINVNNYKIFHTAYSSTVS